jgi:ribonuclease P protein component
MLPAANRMRTAADFTQTTRRGSKVTRGSVVVYVTLHEDDSDPRVGLIVSKAVGNSVARHRVARRIRGAVAPLLPSLAPGIRVVVRALPGAATDSDLADEVVAGVSVGLSRRSVRE